ncbi:hypothetical protein B566_EDAN007921 [Ephemera danica]|nr:hypothetical protein B566_EDAN007921 [Ephemera danica]
MQQDDTSRVVRSSTENADTTAVNMPAVPAPETETAHAERLRAGEERKRAIRYTAGGVAFVGALFALYYATSHRASGGTSALAGLLAPAAIMVLYLLWVLYSTHANRHAARMAAAAAATAAAEQNNANNVGGTTSSETTLVSIEPPAASTRPLTRASSKLALNTNGSLHEGRTLNSIPRGMRNSNAALHRSTESLYRSSSHRNISNLASVHRSTTNLQSTGSRGSSRPSASHQRHRAAMQRSTLQLNNSRQIAAAAANLPTYEEATNRNHWLLTNNHSRERLLQPPPPARQ